MALNAHRVFVGPDDADHYLAALSLEAEREQMLRKACDTCRKAIRNGLQSWTQFFKRSQLFESALANSAPETLSPKFKMQGSFAYRTLNVPAQTPPQEIDLDDGVFLPVSFLNDNGRAHPALISAGYFDAVEALLAPVCEERGWSLVTDKPSCIRVDLHEGAHIDFALYAIPDDEFDELIETAVLAKAARDSGHRALLNGQIEFSEAFYRQLSEDQIMLAHRKEGWKPSDPRKLEDWFKEALSTHGEQLRRICRYIKGWRDYHWSSCRLSSIALMSCVVSTYNKTTQMPSDDRDDLALLVVIEQLAPLLNNQIANPVVDGQYLDEGWSPEERADYVSKANLLCDHLRKAINETNSSISALENLTRAFGDRIPDDHSLIKREVAAPAVLTSGLVKQMGGEPVPQQAVKREGDRRYG